MLLSPLALAALAGCSRPDAHLPTVGVVVFAPDPTNDLALAGLKKGLKEAGFEEGKTVRIDYHDAQGDVNTINNIVRKYVGAKTDIIVPMTTPCLVATANATKGTGQKVVFTEVFDPIAAGVAKSTTEHPDNLTGAASPPPAAALVQLIKELVPHVRAIGTIYNPAEANSVSANRRLLEAARKAGVELVERTVSGSTDVKSAAQSLVGQVQAVCIPGDNTVQVALDSLTSTAHAAKIPVVAGNPAWIEGGLVATMGPDFTEAGRVAGGMAAQVLKGGSPGTIPIQYLDVQELHLSRSAASRLGLTLPEALTKRAMEVRK